MKRKIIFIALLTLIAFPLLGWVIAFFAFPNPLEVMLRSEESLLFQISMGVVVGTILGLMAKQLVSLPFLKPTQGKYARLVQGLKLNHVTVIFVSFCAGFGEELLFRGTLQPLLTIWPTAILFVALHGYLDPRDWRISIYGLFMTLAIALLGYMTEYIGIISACTGHMFIDYVLFQYLRKYKTNSFHYNQPI